MDKYFESFFDTPPDFSLYHYTGIGALLGIAKDEALKASCVYYSNDGEEILYAKKIFNELLDKKIKKSQGFERTFLSLIKKWMLGFEDNPYNVFMFSLSEDPSVLSQWRSYTPHGKGVSIGFSPMVIKNIIKENDLKIAKCVYSKPDQARIIDELINSIFETTLGVNGEAFKDVNNPNHEEIIFDVLKDNLGSILQVFSTIKHSAFREEKEWRLISKYYPEYTVPEIKYKEGASMLVPYTEFKIKKWHSDKRLGSDVYFEKVILGPSQHASLSYNALQNFCSNKGLTNKTAFPHIPYREWQ